MIELFLEQVGAAATLPIMYPSLKRNAHRGDCWSSNGDPRVTNPRFTDSRCTTNRLAESTNAKWRGLSANMRPDIGVPGWALV